jgi:hypothetical protein
MWDYYAELSCIAIDDETSHVEVCAVVIFIAKFKSVPHSLGLFIITKLIGIKLHEAPVGVWYVERCVGQNQHCGAGKPCPLCSPIIYSLWNCLILVMLMDLRREENAVLRRFISWEMNHHVKCADIFSQQPRTVGDGNAALAPEQKLIALQVLHIQIVG